MTAVDQLVTPEPETTHPPTNRLGTLLAMCAPLIALAAVIWLVSSTNAAPTEGSIEAGFARDMMVHHAQAVEMALMLYDRSDNDTLRTISVDMMLTQQAQIGQMQGWMRLWQLPVASVELPMTWMEMPTDGLMPGMATREQLNILRESSGVDADRQFIQLMIPHHAAGIHMAEWIVDRTPVPAVRELARSIIDSQQREIDILQQILADLE